MMIFQHGASLLWRCVPFLCRNHYCVMLFLRFILPWYSLYFWLCIQGIHPTIKGEVWEFLLGCYDPKSTTEQRNQLRQQRRLEYEKLKTKCREMDTTVGSGRVITMPVITEDGQPIEDPNADGGARPSSVGSEQQTSGAPLPKEVVQWKLTLHQIGLDVNRTDRVLVYYESQENLARLWDILTVYSWVDKDIGYCQGMSDLCSPISIILEHEADAFWCFERLMRRVVSTLTFLTF